LLKCIIIEDEVLAQDVIKSHLARIGALELAGVYRNAPEAEAALKTGEIDIMFLDIRLPGMSGLQFLRGLKDPPLVVLTTAYAEYALESYEFNVIDYLLSTRSWTAGYSQQPPRRLTSTRTIISSSGRTASSSGSISPRSFTSRE